MLQKKWFGPCKQWGICATKPFVTGEFICEYIGRRVQQLDEINALKDDTSGSFYRCFYNRCNKSVLCIDGDKESHHLGRLINHSRKNPNAKMVALDIDSNIHLVLVARSAIQVGEEILYDYGERRKELISLYPWLKN